MYRCVRCKKIYEKIDRIICLNCGYRIFEKIRPQKIKRVQAR
ncbi:MAG: DNA-directed RNA polymerase subunit P [Candidatus Aenigmatarchaeota archaeon]